MPHIDNVVEALTLDSLLSPDNQFHYYEPSLYEPGRDLTKEERLRAVHLPYYPVVKNPRQIGCDGQQTQIPVSVKDARESGMMMGLLISKSTLFDNLFVLIHEPTPSTVQLPTSIGKSLLPQQEFGPIQGFVLLSNANFDFWHQLMLLVGPDRDTVEAVTPGFLSRKKFLAGLLMRKVIKAQNIYDSKNKNPGENYDNTMRLEA